MGDVKQNKGVVGKKISSICCILVAMQMRFFRLAARPMTLDDLELL